MKLTIWKYPFVVTDNVELVMPADARILTVQVQHDTPCLWALVDPSREQVVRHFRLAGTGHPLNDGVYIGTFQLSGGDLVFHLFEPYGTLAP